LQAADLLTCLGSSTRPAGEGDRFTAVSLLTELDAFYTEHRRCSELEAGVDGPTVWIRVRLRGQQLVE
jgi:hypothetical protein